MGRRAAAGFTQSLSITDSLLFAMEETKRQKRISPQHSYTVPVRAGRRAGGINFPNPESLLTFRKGRCVGLVPPKRVPTVWKPIWLMPPAAGMTGGVIF